MRAMPPSDSPRPYNQYEVVKPIEVDTAVIAPAFNKIGLGTQHKLPESVKELKKSGHLKDVIDE